MLNIKLEKFEGPLSLLLKMIEKEKLDITEISLAKVADQYVEYIKNSQDINPESVADFLVIAAKLLYIKSKALLPYLFPEEDEEEDLEKQLKMYRVFIEASRKIEARVQEKKFMFVPDDRKALCNVLRKGKGVFSPPKKTTKDDLKNVFKIFLTKLKPKEQKLEEETIEYKVNIEEKILHLEQSLIKRIKVSFNDFLKKARSKTEVIVSFLAMLELVKQKDLDVEQESLFSDIMIGHKDKKITKEDDLSEKD